jgi:hypothetical protein
LVVAFARTMARAPLIPAETGQYLLEPAHDAGFFYVFSKVTQ